jgi:CubicO group peptidase (beta-lactamase class C family)
VKKLTLIPLLFIPLVFVAQNNSEKLEKFMQAMMETNGYSGNVIITRNDSVLLKKSYGFADREKKNPNTLSTKFWIGSLTKQFTAASILILEQQGKLSTEDKLSKYYPQFPNADKITLHQMLCHRTGMFDFEDLAFVFNYSSEKIIKKAAKRKAVSEPGTVFYYNDTPFLLLSCIVEKVSGLTFEEFLKKEIFSTVGMTGSGILKSKDEKIPNSAEGDPGISQGKRKMSVKGAGALYSTIDDLYKWDCALMGTKILNETSKKKMFTNYTSKYDCGNCQNYGYGMDMDTIADHFCYMHGGELVGMRSYNMIFPKENVKIIILRNNMGSVYFSFALAGIVFNKSVEIPTKSKEIQLADSSLTKYCGSYSLKKNSSEVDFVIEKKKGKLYGGWAGGELQVLKAEVPGRFFYNNDEFQREIVFTNDQMGNQPTALYLLHGFRGRDLYLIKK